MRAKWPLWGAAAGVLGVTANVVVNPEAALGGHAATAGHVADVTDRAGYHVAAVAGFLAVACLIVTAAAWRRWAEQRAPESLAVRVVPVALGASAGAMIAAYGVMGALAMAIPDGLGAGELAAERLDPLFVVADVGPFLAWQGVAVAAGAVCWMAFGDGVVTRWVGAASGVAALLSAAVLFASGVPNLAGAICPAATAVAFAGMAMSRKRPIEVTAAVAWPNRFTESAPPKAH